MPENTRELEDIASEALQEAVTEVVDEINWDSEGTKSFEDSLREHVGQWVAVHTVGKTFEGYLKYVPKIIIPTAVPYIVLEVKDVAYRAESSLTADIVIRIAAESIQGFSVFSTGDEVEDA